MLVSLHINLNLEASVILFQASDRCKLLLLFYVGLVFYLLVQKLTLEHVSAFVNDGVIAHLFDMAASKSIEVLDLA